MQEVSNPNLFAAILGVCQTSHVQERSDWPCCFESCTTLRWELHSLGWAMGSRSQVCSRAQMCSLRLIDLPRVSWFESDVKLTRLKRGLELKLVRLAARNAMARVA